MTPTIPQAVTERYTANLLRDGQNREFRLTTIASVPTFVREKMIGHHYIATVATHKVAHEGVGATPLQAVTNSLEIHGVTFR